LSALRLDDKTLKEKDSITELIQPGVSIPNDATKVHGITNEMVEGKFTFGEYFFRIREFFHGERILIAHNCAFDVAVLRIELERIGKLCCFPWPGLHICTVEKSFHIRRRRLNLGELYELATGKQMQTKHTAKGDVYALAEIVRWLKQNEKL
jgi:DNA polymerase-3 subunit epsilon